MSLFSRLSSLKDQFKAASTAFRANPREYMVNKPLQAFGVAVLGLLVLASKAVALYFAGLLFAEMATLVLAGELMAAALTAIPATLLLKYTGVPYRIASRIFGLVTSPFRFVLKTVGLYLLDAAIESSGMLEDIRTRPQGKYFDGTEVPMQRVDPTEVPPQPFFFSRIYIDLINYGFGPLSPTFTIDVNDQHSFARIKAVVLHIFNKVLFRTGIEQRARELDRIRWLEQLRQDTRELQQHIQEHMQTLPEIAEDGSVVETDNQLTQSLVTELESISAEPGQHQEDRERRVAQRVEYFFEAKKRREEQKLQPAIREAKIHATLNHASQELQKVLLSQQQMLQQQKSEIRHDTIDLQHQIEVATQATAQIESPPFMERMLRNFVPSVAGYFYDDAVAERRETAHLAQTEFEARIDAARQSLEASKRNFNNQLQAYETTQQPVIDAQNRLLNVFRRDHRTTRERHESCLAVIKDEAKRPKLKSQQP